MTRFVTAVALVALAALPAAAAVTGIVMNSEGQPVAGARVAVFAPELPDATRARLLSASPERSPLGSGSTNAKGAFAIDTPKDVPVVVVNVTAEGFAPRSLRGERDEDLGAVPLTRAASKTGRITAGGKPVSGARVVWAGGGDVVATTDGEGRYSVPDPAKWAGGLTIIHKDYAIVDELPLRGPSAAPALDRSLTEGVALIGTVVGADGKTPVAGATITVDGWPAGTSAPDGSFVVRHAPARWELVTARSGDLIGTRARSSAAPVIRLAKGGVLSGTLRDAKGRVGIAGAEVRLRVGGRGRPTDIWAALTDAAGNFSLAPVLPGTYILSASRPGYLTGGGSSVSVTAGERLTRSMTATQLARLSGTVVDEQKHPLSGARVMSRRAGRDMSPFGFGGYDEEGGSATAPNGTWSLRVTPDADLEVFARQKGYPESSPVRVRLSAGERKSAVVLTIPAGYEVTGRVVDRDGKPVSAATVDAVPVSAAPIGAIFSFGAFRVERDDDGVKTGQDGVFHLRLKEGKYDFAFEGSGFAPKALRAVEVSAGMRPIEVTLVPGAEVTGRVVRSGAGIAGASVWASGEAGGSYVETAADGSFRLTDLSAGRVMLTVSKPDESIQISKTITAPAADLVVEVPPGGRLAGRVVDKTTKQPITSFQVGVAAPRLGGMAIVMPAAMRPFTSDDGSFAVENVPAGQVTLSVSAPGYAPARLPNLTVEEGKTSPDVQVEMEHGVRLTGRVTGSDGEPLAGGAVRLDARPGNVTPLMPGAGTATTDANGDYVLESLPAGDRAFMFMHAGYVPASKSVSLSGDEVRLDVQLSKGLSVNGVVVTEDGTPVAEAGVRALSLSQAGFGGQATRTDATGAFSIEGLAPGRYTFTANKSGYATSDVRDFDITAGAPVRIVLKTGGTVYGHVAGLGAAELQGASVSATGTGGGASAPVDESGNYRIEGAPTGTIRVGARLSGGFNAGRTTPVVSAQVEPGNSVQVDLSFATGSTVRGRITRNGKAVDGAMVNFTPKEAQATTTARSTTGSNGEYEVNGLDDAPYNVFIFEPQHSPYTATYDLRGGGTFDVDIKSASLRGRVISSDGTPVPDATVTIRPLDQGAAPITVRAQTDATGNFLSDAVAVGNYAVSGEKSGFTSKRVETTVADTGATVEIVLTPGTGVTMTIVDARTNIPIVGRVRVTDTADRPVYESAMAFPGSAEPQTLPLEPGSYRAYVSAFNYATKVIALSSPSTLTVGLTPGATIAIASKSSERRRGRLMTAAGTPYNRGFGADAFFSIDPAPGVTMVANVDPGTYTLQIVGADNQVESSTPVTAMEGRTVTVSP